MHKRPTGRLRAQTDSHPFLPEPAPEHLYLGAVADYRTLLIASSARRPVNVVFPPSLCRVGNPPSAPDFIAPALITCSCRCNLRFRDRTSLAIEGSPAICRAWWPWQQVCNGSGTHLSLFCSSHVRGVRPASCGCGAYPAGQPADPHPDCIAFGLAR